MREMKTLRSVSKPLMVLVALLTATVVVTAVSLFSQNFPAVPTAVTMTGNCENLLASLVAPSPLIVGDDGQATFQCSGPNAAFTVSGGTVSATPSFTLPAPYTELWIYVWDNFPNTGPCTDRDGALQLTDDALETIPSAGWNYCAEFVDVGNSGLSGFGVDWTA